MTFSVCETRRCDVRALGRGRLLPPSEGRDGCDVAAARPRGRDADRRREPRARGARNAADAAALAHCLRGGLLRARRLGARVAGRRRARGAAARLCDPPRERARAHVHRRRGRARVPRLRHASPDRDRLVAALARDQDRAPVGRGTRRRPLGRRGDERAARLRRPGAAPGEHPQRGRGRARALGRPARRRRRWRRRSGRSSRGSTGSRSRRELAARLRTATPRRKRSSSSSRAARRSSCGRHRHARLPARSWRSTRCGPAISSRGRRGRESRTRSSRDPKG